MRTARNNFDALRIALATIVFYYHMGALTGHTILSKMPGIFAVHCFFVISGYLIVKSYLKRLDVLVYSQSRFFRIYPLYFCAITTCFIIGYLNYSGSFPDYLHAGALKYLISNYFFANFLQLTLPRLFIHNISPIVNGSLWTIKVEVMFYLSVPLIYGYRGIKQSLAAVHSGDSAVNQQTKHTRLTILLATLSVLFHYLMGYLIINHGFHHSLDNQLPSVMVFFMAGALFNFINLTTLKMRHLLLICPLLYLFNPNVA